MQTKIAKIDVSCARRKERIYAQNNEENGTKWRTREREREKNKHTRSNGNEDVRVGKENETYLTVMLMAFTFYLRTAKQKHFLTFFDSKLYK